MKTAAAIAAVALLLLPATASASELVWPADAEWRGPAALPVLSLAEDADIAAFRRRHTGGEMALRLWSMAAIHAQRIGSTLISGFGGELGIELGSPTFGAPGADVTLSLATAFGVQYFADNGRDHSAGVASINVLAGYQYRFHHDDSLQFSVFARAEFATRRLHTAAGDPLIGGDGRSALLIGGAVRYIWRSREFIAPVSAFVLFDLGGGAREFTVGVDLGGLIALGIVTAVAAAHGGHHYH